MKTNAINLNGIGMTSQRTRDRLLSRLIDQGIGCMRLLDVVRSTPRHIFLDEALAHKAYEDVALPIGFNQTISQPYIVAKITELILNTGKFDHVLEIGTGCGYQTAILAQLAKSVSTVERIKPLLERARKNLKLLKLRNIDFRHVDGSLGWKKNAPYDAIIATAAPQRVPEALLQQLAPGGRLIIPVGGESNQRLQLITRDKADFNVEVLEQVKFVPLLCGQLQS